MLPRLSSAVDRIAAEGLRGGLGRLFPWGYIRAGPERQASGLNIREAAEEWNRQSRAGELGARSIFGAERVARNAIVFAVPFGPAKAIELSNGCVTTVSEPSTTIGHNRH